MKQLFLIFTTFSLLFGAPVFAQKEDRPALSMRVFKQLSQIEQSLVKQEFEQAQNGINKILKRKQKLSEVDRAYSYHMQAVLYLYQEKFSLAREAFVQSYQLKHTLDENTQLQVVELLANLSINAEDYQQAISYTLEYQKLAKEPNKSSYLTLASSYYYLQNYRAAIEPLKQVIENFPPDKAAYSTLFAVYYELKELKKATEIVVVMVRNWPQKKDYWLQLASIHLEQEQFSQALEVLELSYQQGFLIKETELQQFIHVLYEKGLPLKAAVTLQSAIDKQSIQPAFKSWELLAQMYAEAKEDRKAINSYLKAAELSTTGIEYLYAAQMYFELEEYKRSIQYANKAIEKGIKRPANAYRLMAASYQELKDQKGVKKSLKMAKKVAG